MSAQYHRILVPIDLADAELAKPAIASAVMMAKESHAVVRLINVLPVTPAMLAEYVPPDFEAQQHVRHKRQSPSSPTRVDCRQRASRASCGRAASTAKFSTRPSQCMLT
jgi:nucleotide-binding universal stress UspA family protein